MLKPRYFIPLLGLSQIVSWGTIYYSLAVLAQPILQQTGWSNLVVYGAFSLSLLIAGFVAPSVGRWIDKTGGRLTMTLGSLMAVLAFLVLSQANTPLVYGLGWCLAGLAMALTLYEAAFSVTHTVTPQNYRRNVTLLTLFGGFASTVFWPISHYLNELLGWRDTLLVFALLHLFITLPIHWFSLPKQICATLKPQPIPLQQTPYRPGSFKWLVISFALVSAVFSVMSVFIIDALQQGGFERNQSVWLAALIGPLQVVGRLIELFLARHLRVYLVGLAALFFLMSSLLLLNFVSGSWWLGWLFVLLYGVANGVMTIVRAALPVELYGRENVGLLLGRLALPSFVAKALMPAIFASILMLGIAMDWALWGLFLLALVALLAYLNTRNK